MPEAEEGKDGQRREHEDFNKPELPRARITAREREIVALIVAGFSNKDIARELDIAVHTVKTHVHNILEKLDVRNRLQLAALMRTHRSLHPKT